jgi:hypothetical protein
MTTVAEAAEPDKVCCLVGSSRFKAQFHELGERLEKQGWLVLMMSFFEHADDRPVSAGEREVLDVIGRRRIDLCREVWVINPPMPRCPACKTWCKTTKTHVGTMVERACGCPGGVPGWEATPVELAPYIGESTAKEIAYAGSRGKVIHYLGSMAGVTTDA